ncbi:MAG: hypothetical protein ACKO96_15860, partial [Flammeovirgaceae bacterium]
SPESRFGVESIEKLPIYNNIFSFSIVYRNRVEFNIEFNYFSEMFGRESNFNKSSLIILSVFKFNCPLLNKLSFLIHHIWA